MKDTFRKIFTALVAITALNACDSVDDNRIPFAEVHLTFHTVGDWNIYGVPGAADYRRYIFTPTEKVPDNFPYSALDRTGFGGLLLVSDAMGELSVYDLSCPVEARPNIRITVPAATGGGNEAYAECPSCKSRYDVSVNRGNPMSGPAAERGFGLQRYSIVSGGATEYRVITR